MLNVFITVDAEFSPSGAMDGWNLCRDMDRDMWGRTSRGDFGLGFQVRMLWAHSLTGVFLVDSLAAEAVGVEPMREVVSAIRQAGQDAQHHLHTEWVARLPGKLLPPGRAGKSLRNFTLDEQRQLLARGRALLESAGATRVVGFRAGGFGANYDTLRALAATGHHIDTSYNPCWQGVTCDMPMDGPLMSPRQIEGVWELPVTVFADWPGHLRHLQLGACSAGEMRTVLMEAAQRNWGSVVIVCHSHELVLRDGRTRPDRVLIRRFERLCDLLAGRRDLFRTRGFADLAPAELPAPPAARPLGSNPLHMAWRYSEQLVRRYSCW